VTATQIIVLVLLVLAFAAGWVARGAGRRDDRRFTTALGDGLEALEAAQQACDAALGRNGRGELDGVAAQLRTARHELAEWIGADSPLVEDVEAARDAMTLISTAVRDGTADTAAPLAAVVRDARVRYARSVRAINLLPE
jgi:hypothetical protein